MYEPFKKTVPDVCVHAVNTIEMCPPVAFWHTFVAVFRRSELVSELEVVRKERDEVQ